VDLNHPSLRVVRFDPHLEGFDAADPPEVPTRTAYHPAIAGQAWSRCYRLEAPSLEGWIELSLTGHSLVALQSLEPQVRRWPEIGRKPTPRTANLHPEAGEVRCWRFERQLPATPDRRGVNPFTKQPMVIKGFPERLQFVALEMRGATVRSRYGEIALPSHEPIEDHTQTEHFETSEEAEEYAADAARALHVEGYLPSTSDRPV
jgi:hypothetical protein